MREKQAKEWRLQDPAPREQIETLRHVPPLLVQLLYNRGVREPSEVEAFLSCDERLMPDPFLFSDMERAVHRLHHARLSGELVAVFGDFDADGVTATALLTKALTSLGTSVLPYLPHRVSEGHGLNPTAVEHLRAAGATVLVTVDCGITSYWEVAQAQQLGMDVIITDHHSPPMQLPPAHAIITPRWEHQEYPFQFLTGAGLALKLAQGLFRDLQQPTPPWLLELAALGTVADVAPLTGENRYIVKNGLEELNRTSNPGLAALIQVAKLKPGEIETETVAWSLAPRINAAGRIEHAIISYDLLTTDSPSDALHLAKALENLNGRRQGLTQESLDKVRNTLDIRDLPPLLMTSDPSFSPGVIGLVAGKLTEEFYRPAVVVSIGEETSRGSARSTPVFNIIAALRECAPLLLRFGGHAQAAGFSIANSNLPALKDNLLALASAALGTADAKPRIDIDAQLPLDRLGTQTFRNIRLLAPFGVGNPVPVFLARGVRVIEARLFGKKNEHLKLRLKEKAATWPAVAFDSGGRWQSGTDKVDLVYSLAVDRWQGREVMEINIQDLKPSS